MIGAQGPVAAGLEVGGDALFQALSLADVDDAAQLVFELIRTR